MNLFALPLIGRAGLGNALFPWARAELFALRTGARILAPHWTSLRIGPYLRREPDKRRYSGFFYAPHHVRGLSRFAIRTFGKRIEEDSGGSRENTMERFRSPCMVEFSGLDGFFSPLVEWHDVIREQLWRMTVKPLRSTGGNYGSRFIAMHVRRGDITRQGLTPQQLVDVVQYTPLSWFVKMVQAVRRIEALRSVPIIIFTDGTGEELRKLCKLEGVLLHHRQQAITDLWTLSNASLLFASGYSTFGMWASYLGGMPTIYAPGKIMQYVQTGRAQAIEMEVTEGDEIPDKVLVRIRWQA